MMSDTNNANAKEETMKTLTNALGIATLLGVVGLFAGLPGVVAAVVVLAAIK